MSVTSGFFPILSGVEDVLYDSEHVGKVYQGLYLNGVSSIIGNFFACRIKNLNTIYIDTGFAYFNGYFVKSDSIIECDIPDYLYPERNISILITSQPQLDYPESTNLDLGNIKVSEISGIKITDIILEGDIQTDYPESTNLDLGNAKVFAEFEEGGSDVSGNVYIVIRFDHAGRKFDIKAINVNDYNIDTDILLAVVNRDGDEISIKNMVGYRDNIYTGPALLSGINQSLYLEDLIYQIDTAYDLFMETWVPVKKDYFNALFADVRYNLDTPYQFARLSSAINNKASKMMTFYKHVVKNDTSYIFRYSNIPENRVIKIRPKYIDLAITDIDVSGTTVAINFLPAEEECDLFVDIFDIGDLENV